MDINLLQERLLAVAKAAPSNDHVPLAFEKRITALLQARRPGALIDGWLLGLWRAALSCVVIAGLCGAFTFYSSTQAKPASEDLSQNFENTLLASVDPGDATP